MRPRADFRGSTRGRGFARIAMDQTRNADLRGFLTGSKRNADLRGFLQRVKTKRGFSRGFLTGQKRNADCRGFLTQVNNETRIFADSHGDQTGTRIFADSHGSETKRGFARIPHGSNRDAIFADFLRAKNERRIFADSPRIRNETRIFAGSHGSKRNADLRGFSGIKRDADFPRIPHRSSQTRICADSGGSRSGFTRIHAGSHTTRRRRFSSKLGSKTPGGLSCRGS